MGFIQACGFLVWLLRTEQSQLKMLVTEQLMQPAACYRMGKKSIRHTCLKNLQQYYLGYWLKLNICSLLNQSLLENILFLKRLSRLMFKNLFNYKQASSEKNYGLAKILSEEKNRTEICIHRMLLIIFKKMQANVYALERLEGNALSYLKDFK